MSKVVWDAVGERFYETGVSHGVLYLQKSDGTYENGVGWTGLTAVNESPDGADPNDLYADNIKYATMRSAENVKFTIEAYTHPDEFYECDGNARPAGVHGLYVKQQPRRAFGFSYRNEVGNDVGNDPDDGYKLHLVYNCTASPSSRDHATINDSPDAETMSWEVSTNPVNIEGYKPAAELVLDTTKMTASEKVILKSLEDTLYGTASTEPTLPSPDAVLAMFGGATEAVTLTGLTISGATLDPTFDSGITVYTTSVTADSSTITATPESGAAATIQVNNEVVANGGTATWNEGHNVVTVSVSKPGSITSTYTIGVTKS